MTVPPADSLTGGEVVAVVATTVWMLIFGVWLFAYWADRYEKGRRKSDADRSED